MAKTALIVGAGDGISAAFARALARDGYRVGLAARRPDKLARLKEELNGLAFRCDAADEVEQLFAEVDSQLGPVDVDRRSGGGTIGPAAD